MELVKPRYTDPFSPVMLTAPPADVSEERKGLIRDVLDKSSSDSAFAIKAYAAIALILTAPATIVPIVTSVTPGSAEIGSPSFTLHVHGTRFGPKDVIVFAGQLEPTTFVSDNELTTGVDMSVWHGADVLPVMVQSEDGILSAPVNFTFFL